MRKMTLDNLFAQHKIQSLNNNNKNNENEDDKNNLIRKINQTQ